MTREAVADEAAGGGRAPSVPSSAGRHGARLWRDAEGRHLRALDADDPTAVDIEAAAGDPPLVLTLQAAPGHDVQLVCSSAWQRALTPLDVAIDLAASAAPADWLLRLEDRLLDASASDPGPYAALAWWVGELPRDEPGSHAVATERA